MKLKYRLLVDALMFILIWVCMEYRLTGGFLHELLGIVLILGFLFHAFINRKYYVVMTKQIFSEEPIAPKRFLAYIVNVILLCDAFFLLISSVAISKELFYFFTFFDDMNFMWRIIHVISAVIALVCIMIHAVLHGKMIFSLIGKHIKSSAVVSVLRGASRVLAIVLAALVLKLSIDNVGGIVSTDHERKAPPQGVYKESDKKADTDVIYESEVTEDDAASDSIEDDTIAGPGKNDDDAIAEDSKESTDESITEEAPSSDEVSLADYLKNLNCTGCHRHCSLASPQCGRGRQQAQEAEAEYNEQYGDL